MEMETHPQGNEERLTSRPPTEVDLISICDGLNKAGAQYVVVGGWAIIQSGYPRYTEDIDLLISTEVENEAIVLGVLSELPDRVAAQVRPGEVAEYGVVRIGDEVLVDLMKSGCGVTYADAIQDAVWYELKGIRIPFASKKTLWKMKQTLREKDNPDRLFLAQSLTEEGIPLDPPPRSVDPDEGLPAWAKAVVAALRFLFKKH